MTGAVMSESSSAALYPTGLIVGRFDPPHLGHSFMIDQATATVSTSSCS